MTNYYLGNLSGPPGSFFIHLTNRQFSMVCTLIDYKNDVKMFNTQVEPNELKCILLMIR